MIDFFTDPLAYQFFRNGLYAATLSGALCGMMGVYIVLRRMSYIGHGLSHSVFGGAVVSYIIGINFYLGAGAWGFLSALLINATARRRKIGADAAIGIVTTASFALGVALISRRTSKLAPVRCSASATAAAVATQRRNSGWRSKR